MFRSVVISHDGSRSVEGTVHWLEPLLGHTHARVELFGRRDAPDSSELNSRAHLEELAEELTVAGAHVDILDERIDLMKVCEDKKLVVVHDPDLAIRILRQSKASLLFTPEGVRPHRPQRIIVALDGSDYSEEILPLLVPFARAFRPRVELVRVPRDEEVSGQGSLMAGTTSIPTRQELLKSLEGATTYLRAWGIEAEPHTTEAGIVPRRLLEAAEQSETDLVAVSTYGRNRLARWLFGSTAESLVRAGRFPILVRNPRPDSPAG